MIPRVSHLRRAAQRRGIGNPLTSIPKEEVEARLIEALRQIREVEIDSPEMRR